MAAPTRLPDVRQALAWRDIHSGLDEAAARRVPILCLAESPWSNGAQRLALVLGQHDETRDLVESSFVPVIVDPLERPDVAARLAWAASTLTGTVGPPLLALLTPSGSPFLAYCTLWPEGRDPYPSLHSLLRSVADLDRERRTALENEAMALQARAGGRAASAPRHTAWQRIRDHVDARFGGLQESPKCPHPHVLWQLLDEAAHPPVRAHLVRTLEGMQRGGILDQLDGAFHRCSRDERWIVPHFEKLVPTNAALAAVYARAASLFDRPDFLATADGAAAFAAAGLESGTMVIASDARHYTWTPGQFQEELDPGLIQALGLHFKITRDDSPHVLYRALEADQMGDYADEDPAVLSERIDEGKAHLLRVRMRRPPPARHAVDAPAWHAETLRWLFEAGRHDVDVDEGMLDRRLRALLAGHFDPNLGYARTSRAGARYWLEDQTALATACLAAGAGVPEAHGSAIVLADIILEAYCDAETGALLDAPHEGGGRRRPSQAVVDGTLWAAVPSTIELLRTLAHEERGSQRSRSTSCVRFERAAEVAERRHRDATHAASAYDLR